MDPLTGRQRSREVPPRTGKLDPNVSFHLVSEIVHVYQHHSFFIQRLLVEYLLADTNCSKG